MPVTKTAKRALRSSKRKQEVNKLIKTKLEMAIRLAKKSRSKKNLGEAFSIIDRAAKKNLIHKNKAARIKSRLVKFVSRKAPKKATKTSKK